MNYQTYKNREKQVEAAKFENLEDIGEMVQALFDSGCGYINVKDVPLNPQLEDTSYITTIAFKQNDTIQVLFLGDILSFDEDDNAVVWDEEDFLNNYEVVIPGNGG